MLVYNFFQWLSDVSFTLLAIVLDLFQSFWGIF